jgi:hypothetical protein
MAIPRFIEGDATNGSLKGYHTRLSCHKKLDLNKQLFAAFRLTRALNQTNFAAVTTRLE